MTHGSEPRAVQVLISGRVQGVGFRAWTADMARSLGLSGWVRNRAAGDVEAVFSGPADDVDAMLAACRMGPPHARVTDVEVIAEVAPATGGFVTRPDS